MRKDIIVVGLYTTGLITLFMNPTKKQLYDPRKNKWL